MSLIASSANELNFHRWPEGQLQYTYTPAHSDVAPIKTISYGKDGSQMAVVPNFSSVEVLTLHNNIKLSRTLWNVDKPTSATFQNNIKDNLAIGNLDGQLTIYNVKTKQFRKRFPTVDYAILDIRYNSKDTHIAAGCANGKILVFNNMSVNIASTFVIPKSKTISSINFHRRRQNILVAGSEKGIVAIWNINSTTPSCQLQVHNALVTDVMFSPIHLDLLITSGMDRKFSCFDLLSKKCIIEVEVASSITALDFSNCGIYLGLGSENGNVVLYDVRNLNKPISSFKAHKGKKIRHVCFQKVLLQKNSKKDCCLNMLNDSLELQKLENRSDMGDLNAQKNIEEDENPFLIDIGQRNSNELN